MSLTVQSILQSHQAQPACAVTTGAPCARLSGGELGGWIMTPPADRVNLSGWGWDHRLDTAKQQWGRQSRAEIQSKCFSKQRGFCKELTPSRVGDKTCVGFTHQVWGCSTYSFLEMP